MRFPHQNGHYAATKQARAATLPAEEVQA